MAIANLQGRGNDFSVAMAVHVTPEPRRQRVRSPPQCRAKFSFRTAIICQIYHLITHIDRLQETSPEELKMFQNLLAGDNSPGPHCRTYTAVPKPLPGGLSPLPKNSAPPDRLCHSGLELASPRSAYANHNVDSISFQLYAH